MSKNCKILKVNAPNGQTSILFQDLLSEYQNAGVAFRKYLELSAIPTTTRDANNEPVLASFIETDLALGGNGFNTHPDSERNSDRILEKLEDKLGVAKWRADASTRYNTRTYSKTTHGNAILIRKVNAYLRKENLNKSIKLIKRAKGNDTFYSLRYIESTEDNLLLSTQPITQIQQDRVITRKKEIRDLKEAERQLIAKEGDNTTELLATRIQITQKENEIGVLEDSIEYLASEFNKGNLTTGEVAKMALQQLQETENVLAEIAEGKREPLTAAELNYHNNILGLWEEVGDFTKGAENHILFTEEEFYTPEIQKTFMELSNESMRLQSKLFVRKKELVLEFTQQYTSSSVTMADIEKLIKDAGFMSAETLNVGRHESPILQAMFKAISQKNWLGQQKALDEFKILEEIFEDARPELEQLRIAEGYESIFDIFKQRTTNGLETGRIISHYSDKFFKERQYQKNRAFGKEKGGKREIEGYYKWLRENTYDFDARILEPDTPTALSQEMSKEMQAAFYHTTTAQLRDKAAEEAELKGVIGDVLFEKLYENPNSAFKRAITRFKNQREAVYYEIKNSDRTEEDKVTAMKNWNMENSPYYSVELQINPTLRKKQDGSFYNTSKRYVIEVPRRTKATGEDTGFYEKQYETIQQYPKAFEYFMQMQGMNKDSMFKFNTSTSNIQSNQTLFLAKTFHEMNKDTGMLSLAPFRDKVVQLLTDIDSGEIDTLKKDAQGKVIKKIKVQGLFTFENLRNEFFKEEIMKATANEGILTTARQKEIAELATHKASQAKSWDLMKVMRHQLLASHMYEHKEGIEDIVKVTQNYFQEKKELQTTLGGTPQMRNNREAKKEGIGMENLKGALNHYLDAAFYNLPTREKGKATSKKLLTAQEKARKQELIEALRLSEEKGGMFTPEQVAEVEKQIEELGKPVTAVGIGDAALKYVQLKGMGWNVFASFANLGFGFISNWIEAGDGRSYNEEEFKEAYLLTMNSVASNITFHAADTPNAKKIRNLMLKYDVLEEAADELYKTEDYSSYNKFIKNFGPYMANKRSEYVNQAPIMIAMMMRAKAKDSSGKEVRLWDALNEEGALKEGFSFGDNVNSFLDLQSNIKAIIQRNHGDYSNPLKFKSKWFGRALGQFRTWMIEGVAQRWESEYFDYNLGYARKGRWRSYGTYFSDDRYSAMEKGGFLLKQLTRKMLNMIPYVNFNKDVEKDLKERFSELDAANLKANLNEIVILLGIMGTGMLLSGLKEGDDDDEALHMKGVRMLLNLNNRLQTDILFYINPVDFERLTKSALPVMGIMLSLKNLSSAVLRQVDNDPKNDEVASGSFKGMNWALKAALEELPGTAQATRLYKTADKVIGE